MNKIDRVLAALAGAPVDRVPASFWFHFPAAERAGHAMAQAHLRYYRAADPDFLKVMNDNGYALTGTDGIRTPADWRRLRPAPLQSRPFQDQLDGLKEIADTIGGETLLISTIFNPYATGNDISGRVVTEHLKADPEAVSAGLATIAESLARFAEECLQAGAAGIYFSAQGGEEDRFTPELWERYVQPHDITVLRTSQAAGSRFDLLHLCGERLRLQSYVAYPAHAVNWAPQLGNPSLREGKALFKRTVVGGVDQRGPIVAGTPDEIRAEVHAAISEAGRVGFIVGAGCTVPSDVPITNLVIAREATV
ncbi:MAG: uroporphyrinogen decarboxylase family protein [Anaerolineae bacterium]